MRKLIALKGTVIRSGGVKMIEYERCYMCRKCKHRSVIHISGLLQYVDKYGLVAGEASQ